jgi:hypothetical protein
MRTIALALAAAAALAAPAAAQEPPAAGHDCDMEVKRTYRAKEALKRGIPVRVTCDGPATIVVALDFEDRRTGNWITERFGHGGDPGAEGHSGPPGSTRVGTTPTVVRMKLTRWAIPMVRRFPRIRMHVGLGHMLTEHRFPVRREDRTVSWLVR